MIMEKKISTPPEVLCKGYPSQLATFINYARELKFEQKPDYKHLKGLLVGARKGKKIEMDYVYDWSNKKIGSTQEIVIKKNSLSKPIAKEEQPQEKKPQSQQKYGSNQVNKTNSSINQRTKTNLISNNNKTKTDQFNGKPNFIETLAGQKISGPKISVVKR